MSKDKNENTVNETNSWFQYVKSSLSGLAIGGVFGYALQRSHVYLPVVIQAQMNFTNFTMLKMFMTAAATSSLSITLLQGSKLIELEHLPVMWRRNLIGGLLMGASIYILGSCPGTVLAQIGSGIKPAYFIFLGGLVGSALYGFTNEWVSKYLPTYPKEKPAIYQRLQVPLYKLTIPFALMIAGVLYAIEQVFPWTLDSGVAPFVTVLGSISQKVWAPYVAGAVIGSLQLPSYLLANNGIGTSSAYVTMSSKICSLLAPATTCSVSYFKKFNSGLKQVFTPMVNLGIVLGSYYSSLTSPALAIDQQFHHSPLFYIASGAMLLYSSRMANGCPSGSGITGMAKMEIGSFITIASLFAGGIASSLLSSYL
ncbi:hypothetical protein DLAC_10626 [Tieghemostelium lacteum]|uniref:Uncharacterized protein n=1 Tax=Tieghemostelium lacteum TaxID=361077 RepID=A0A151Z4I1_TIELA|nr:hypothetical protein DLAC_10626 [Tieghemostelium lacteum]|eukprot:KYQ88827.1 hypothetical protein DLAC_10626 [Tieghemostelium lacteum]